MCALPSTYPLNNNTVSNNRRHIVSSAQIVMLLITQNRNVEKPYPWQKRNANDDERWAEKEKLVIDNIRYGRVPRARYHHILTGSTSDTSANLFAPAANHVLQKQKAAGQRVTYDRVRLMAYDV